MKNTIITIIAFLGLLLSPAMVSPAKAQVYIFTYPEDFRNMAEPTFTEEDNYIEEPIFGESKKLLTENQLLWLTIGVWGFIGGWFLKISQRRRNHRRKVAAERMQQYMMTAKAAVVLLFLALTVPTTAKAQVFLDPETMEYNQRIRNNGGSLPSVPILNVTQDQYAPIGEGILLLGCLGGAYLIGKKRKEGKD